MQVAIPSTFDGSSQPARLLAPAEALETPAPLLLWLHTWGNDYRQNLDVPAAVRECRRRGWIFLQPDFRGPNKNPAACGSDAALTDLLDAVTWARRHYRVDDARIYLLGQSGGGHMALLAAGRFPGRWSAVSAWVPISDLARWHAQGTVRGNSYPRDVEACCGGPPSDTTAAEYARRSPITHLPRAAGLPIHIAAGIHDGHTGSVPIDHTLRAFNILAIANGWPARVLLDDQIDEMVRTRRVPATVETDAAFATPDLAPLFHRGAGPAEVTIFEGAHEMKVAAAFDWLARQSRPTSRPE